MRSRSEDVIGRPRPVAEEAASVYPFPTRRPPEPQPGTACSPGKQLAWDSKQEFESGFSGRRAVISILFNWNGKEKNVIMSYSHK